MTGTPTLFINGMRQRGHLGRRLAARALGGHRRSPTLGPPELRDEEAMARLRQEGGSR